MVKEEKTCRIPVRTCQWVTEKKTCQVPVCVKKEVPYTVTRKVARCVEKEVPYCYTRMVCRQVPREIEYEVCRIVPVQVCPQMGGCTGCVGGSCAVGNAGGEAHEVLKPEAEPNLEEAVPVPATEEAVEEATEAVETSASDA